MSRSETKEDQASLRGILRKDAPWEARGPDLEVNNLTL